MIIKEIKGDLFTNSKNSKAHCVSEDLKMGAGIAVIFKKKYNRIQELLSQKKKVGDVAFLKYEDNIYIFNLITKSKFNHKPTMSDMKKSLDELAKLCLRYNVKNLDMPKIGCGLDKLNWTYVKQSIIDSFKDIDIEITIYFL